MSDQLWNFKVGAYYLKKANFLAKNQHTQTIVSCEKN